MKLLFGFVVVLLMTVGSQGIACYVNKPMHEEINKFNSMADQIRHAAGEFTEKAMEFYVTFRGLVQGQEKLFVGTIKFHQLNCSVLESRFHELESWQPGP